MLQSDGSWAIFSRNHPLLTGFLGSGVLFHFAKSQFYIYCISVYIYGMSAGISKLCKKPVPNTIVGQT